MTNLLSIRGRALRTGIALITAFTINSGIAAAQTLTMNSTGPEVVTVQQKLKELGYNIKNVTGVYDNSTKRAVLAFQRDNKIKLSGEVDDKTMKVINTLRPGTVDTTDKPAKAKPAPKDKDHSKTDGNVQSSTEDSSRKPTAVARPKFVPESKPFLPKNKVNGLLATAKKYIGVKYLSGGTTPKGFDCSGYLQFVFKQNGFSLPRTADVQYKLGKYAPVSKLEAGDLVFFHTDKSGEISHCGIYLGNGKFIHASSSKGIRIDELSNEYWKEAFASGKHIVQ